MVGPACSGAPARPHYASSTRCMVKSNGYPAHLTPYLGSGGGGQASSNCARPAITPSTEARNQ